MHNQTTKDKKINYKEWLALMLKKRAELASYKCPGCNITLRTLTPPKGDVYDSMAVCPFCENMHYKIVRPDGKVRVN